MDQRETEILVEFDPSLADDVAGLFEALDIPVARRFSAKNFGGDIQLAALAIELLEHSAAVAAGAIAALAHMRGRKTVKINGFEVSGMSVREIVDLLRALKSHLPTDQKPD